MSRFIILVLLSFFLSLAQAAPLVARNVFNPKIISPNVGTIWPIGTRQTVEWETSNIPPHITNSQVKVVLGHLGSAGGYNLDLDHPLADGLSYTDGKIEVTVPDVSLRNDYIVVVFGDSGNATPAFTITQRGSNSAPSATHDDVEHVLSPNHSQDP